MSVADTLRARYRPELKSGSDLAGIHTMFETALSFIPVPQMQKAEIEKPGTLNANGVSMALRQGLAKGIVPELRRMSRTINERIAATETARSSLGKLNADKSDVTGALLRQEIRAYLRGLSDADRMRALTDKPDPTMVTAALEAPDALSGLNAQTRAHVQQAHVKANHGTELQAIDDRQEALGLAQAAVEMAVREVRTIVGMSPPEFAEWFSGSDVRRAA